MKNRLKFRAWIPEAPMLRENAKSGMFYQEDQYLSSFLDRIYHQYGVNHPAHLDFQIEERLIQCTGLKDKSGKLVYEGDILNYSNKDNHHTKFSEFFVVEFCEQDLGHSSYQQTIGYNATPIYQFNKPSSMDSGRLSDGILDLFDSHDLTIIGNIYENPELLEVVK